MIEDKNHASIEGQIQYGSVSIVSSKENNYLRFILSYQDNDKFGFIRIQCTGRAAVDYSDIVCNQKEKRIKVAGKIGFLDYKTVLEADLIEIVEPFLICTA